MAATPYSYRQYTGNGSTTSFAVPFPYLLKAHVRVYLGFNVLDGTYTLELAETSGYTWTSGTAIQTVAAPAAGQILTVIRQTPNSQQLVEWQDGSTLISADLNTSDLQNLYVVQEQQDRNDAGIVQSTAAKTAATAATTAANSATTAATTATSTANTALSTANTALSTANTASTNASAAVTTANTASTNASAAVSTANSANTTAGTANTNAAAAVTTANSAAASASTAVTTANTASTNASAAVSTANTASSNASTAVSTANTASTNASAAVTTANSAATNASTALSTANTASTNASAAVATANAAATKADSAIAAVASSVNYTPILNVAGIPSTPANNTYIEIADSTGLQSFTPLSGMPSGFVGDAGLSVRLRYTTSPATWNWLNYYANNADSRYLKLAGGTLTGALTLAANPSTALQAATKQYTDAADATLTTAASAAQTTANTAVTNAAAAQATANAALPKTGGTMTGPIVLSGAPTTGLNPTTKTYVDAADSTLTTAAATAQTTANTGVTNAAAAQTTANTAVTNAAAAQTTANAALPKAGGTMSGDITFSGTQSFPGTAPASAILYNRRPALQRGSLFYKTAAATLSVVANAVLNGKLYATATAVTMPGSHTNNTDYAIWQHPTTGALVSDASYTTAPAGATGGSIVGGYHYIPSGRPTAFNNGSPTGAAEILEFSIWDLTWRPGCPDPRGMACIEGGFWIDIYLAGATSYAGSTFSAVPSSKIGLTIADGSSPPLVPAQFGGNGSTAYPDGKWYVFSELARSFGKRLPTYDEFSAGAYGAPEASSRGTDPGTVQWERVSKFGLAQATGVMWHWGADLAGSGAGGAWQTGVTAGRGDVYSSDARAVLLGGSWAGSSNSGSRCAYWSYTPWLSDNSFGARFAAGHLVLG